MRVVAKQNVWVNGQAYRVGEIFCVADELAVQLAFDGLVELVEEACPESNVPTPDKPKTRPRKKK